MDTLDRSAMEYLKKLPAAVPEGKALVHNNVRPVARQQGARGSRYWLRPADPSRLEVCDCGWAPELGQHYKVREQPSNVGA